MDILAEFTDEEIEQEQVTLPNPDAEQHLASIISAYTFSKTDVGDSLPESLVLGLFSQGLSPKIVERVYAEEGKGTLLELIRLTKKESLVERLLPADSPLQLFTKHRKETQLPEEPRSPYTDLPLQAVLAAQEILSSHADMREVIPQMHTLQDISYGILYAHLLAQTKKEETKKAIQDLPKQGMPLDALLKKATTLYLMDEHPELMKIFNPQAKKLSAQKIESALDHAAGRTLKPYERTVLIYEITGNKTFARSIYDKKELIDAVKEDLALIKPPDYLELYTELITRFYTEAGILMADGTLLREATADDKGTVRVKSEPEEQFKKYAGKTGEIKCRCNALRKVDFGREAQCMEYKNLEAVLGTLQDKIPRGDTLNQNGYQQLCLDHIYDLEGAAAGRGSAYHFADLQERLEEEGIGENKDQKTMLNIILETIEEIYEV